MNEEESTDKRKEVGARAISSEGDEYYSAVAKTVDEARKLIEQGFEYVCKQEETVLFKKRK
jgi:hypothetical protein